MTETQVKSDTNKCVTIKFHHTQSTFNKAPVGTPGYTLTSVVNTNLPPKSRVLIPTGITIDPFPGLYPRVNTWQPLTLRGVDIATQTLPSDGTSEINIIVINNNENHTIFLSLILLPL